MKNLICLFLFLNLIQLANATNYYISVSGKNSNNGKSIYKSWSTLQKAADVMLSGDTCFVADGAYFQDIKINRSDSASRDLTFKYINKWGAKITSEKLKYNPWHDDNSYDFYSAFCPEHEILIDNKFVEFYHKKRGNEELIVLINHENSFQDVTLLSKHTIKLKDEQGGNNTKKNKEFYFCLKPAEVKLLYISR